MTTEKINTFCPEDGWDVKIDEDGLCMHCGATATGAAVDLLVEERERIKNILRNCTKEFEAQRYTKEAVLVKTILEVYELVTRTNVVAPTINAAFGLTVSEMCKKHNVQACHTCNNFSCKDNLNKGN